MNEEKAMEVIIDMSTEFAYTKENFWKKKKDTEISYTDKFKIEIGAIYTLMLAVIYFFIKGFPEDIQKNFLPICDKYLDDMSEILKKNVRALINDEKSKDSNQFFSNN